MYSHLRAVHEICEQTKLYARVVMRTFVPNPTRQPESRTCGRVLLSGVGPFPSNAATRIPLSTRPVTPASPSRFPRIARCRKPEMPKTLPLRTSSSWTAREMPKPPRSDCRGAGLVVMGECRNYNPVGVTLFYAAHDMTESNNISSRASLINDITCANQLSSWSGRSGASVASTSSFRSCSCM